MRARADIAGGPPPEGGRALPAAALAAAIAGFVALVAAALAISGGVFDYPLDDPYIHLAIAEQIAAGGYGVNPGELASPGSSPLYPLLLTPFAGEPVQRYLPLFWNVVGLGLAAWLWGRLLAFAGWGKPGWRRAGLAVAALGPIALIMPNVAFTGMEHSLHAAASIAVVIGFLRHITGRGGIAILLVGVVFGSALRFEGMALGLLVGGGLWFTGARLAGMAAGALAVAPVAAFVSFLAANGLDPMPSSVQAKLSATGLGEAGLLTGRAATLADNLAAPAGLLLAIISVAIVVLWRLAPGQRLQTRGWSLFALAAIAAVWAHLLFGQIGWLNRYEHYILVVSAGALLAMLPAALGPGHPGWRPLAAALAVYAAASFVYQPMATVLLPKASRSIQNQHGQMATFAKRYLNTDVAVNDIGWVSWGNPNYVLDLWGLASAQARELRLNDPAPGWAGRLAAEKSVPAAMIFDRWIKDGIGADWVRLGRLQLTEGGGFLGDSQVAFYATAPQHTDRLRAAIAAWQPGLRDGSQFVWDEGMAP